ncbi:DUF6320 domain-containing protein [Butyrivibrio proteoclasticus]|uniref:DUF6320 domain-containing protein n=1 Tax=Butyrivibrio proteoclasticus TaxID=43305 RepID=UPI00047EA19E|nr:DUF6320 domain-containing protein [Butyrivibrio proteoclasticus]
MQYCPKCKVQIRGRKACCPLCQGQLKQVDGEPEAPFPTLKKKKVSSITLFKLATFIFIASEIVFGTVNYQTENMYPFIGITMLGLLVAWITFVTTLYLRNNLIKVITFEVIVAIVVDVYVDFHTGYHGWSVMWMVPSTLLGLAIATVITAKVLKLRLDEYILYLVLDLVMALLQIVFIKMGRNFFTWPAVIVIMIYMILIAGLVIFRFRDLKRASEKMFNM